MVLRAMGMLDDAIRDHLELKRRRGADPGEVEREQAEALAPVSDQGLPEEESIEMDQLEVPPAPQTGAPVIATPDPGGEEEIQETAELDMERELEGAGESELQPAAGSGELADGVAADWQGQDEAFSEDPGGSQEEPIEPAEQTGLAFPEEPSEHRHG